VRKLLARPGLRRLLVGQALSGFGDWMATVALMALVLDITDSSAAVAGVLILRLAPTMVAGSLVARLVGEWNGKRVMLGMDLVRAGVVALVPLVHEVWWVYLWAFVLEAASLVFLPARDAAVPDLAGEDDLPLANSLVLGTSYGTIPLGAAAFGIVAAFGPGAEGSVLHVGLPFWIDGLTFLASFLFVQAIRELDAPVEVAADDALPSFRQALHIPLVRRALPAAASAAAGIGVLFSLGIVFVRDVLDASNLEFAVLIALFGVGAAVGLAALSRGNMDDFTALRTGVAGQGVVVAAMSFAPNIAVTFLGAALFGALTATGLAAGMSYLQRALDGNDRVLAFAAFHVVIRGGLALAAIGAGIADDLLKQVEAPVVGAIPATRLVLFSAGCVVVLGAALASGAPSGEPAT
jgi:MFS family permease